MTGGGGIGGSVFFFFDAGLSILSFSSNGTDESGISSISLFFVGMFCFLHTIAIVEIMEATSLRTISKVKI